MKEMHTNSDVLSFCSLSYVYYVVSSVDSTDRFDFDTIILGGES